MLLSIGFSFLTGNLPLMTDAMMEGAKEAINLSIIMAAVVGLWSGIMEIAVESGIMDGLAQKMKPFLKWLFPNIHPESRAAKYIAANFAANILGLGWAATPTGLKAMEELNMHKNTDATNEMCTFIIMNVSSLQLIPMTVIVYRSQYGSTNPSFITIPGLLATGVSTITAILFCKWKCSHSQSKKKT